MAQDKVYEEKFVSASNCLIGTVPREYSLHQANCQHFVLELLRRLDVQCDHKAYANLKKDSNRPRRYSLVLLSSIGLVINLVIVGKIALPNPVIIIIAMVYHIWYATVMIHDYLVHKDRATRYYNEYRYFGKPSTSETSLYNRRIIEKRSAPRSKLRYLTGLYLYTTWMVWPLSFALSHGFAKYRVWIIFYVALGVITYCICVFLPAYGILAFLKRKNGITRLRRQEEYRRAHAAHRILETKWKKLGGDSMCSQCDPIVYEDNRDRLLNEAIVYIEESQEPCGKKDMEKAIGTWRRQHRALSEKRRVYGLKVMLGTYGVAGIIFTGLWLLYEHYH
jgi:hypothetical protein